MRELTRHEVCQVVRARACAVGGLSALCRQTGMHISTLSNMVHGRNRWTERADAEPVAVVAVRQARAYKPMWKLGDWPSF